jgi:hypothetical protein
MFSFVAQKVIALFNRWPNLAIVTVSWKYLPLLAQQLPNMVDYDMFQDPKLKGIGRCKAFNKY